MKPTNCGIFVTGTDTGIGKTFVAAAIASTVRGKDRLKVGVYKPAASGCLRDENGMVVSNDAVRLWQAAGCPKTLDAVCPHRFVAPLAPHLAARLEGRELSFEAMLEGVRVWNDCDFVVVEGAGGLMSPVGDSIYLADLAYAFGYPLLVVAPNRIGVINHVIQTLIAANAFREGLRVAGVILNDLNLDQKMEDPSRDSNLSEIVKRCPVPIAVRVSRDDSSTLSSFDWVNLARSTGNPTWQDRVLSVK